MSNPCDDRATKLEDLNAASPPPGAVEPILDDGDVLLSIGAANCGGVPPVIRLRQRQHAKIHVVIRDAEGAPMPLSAFAGHKISFAIKEHPASRKSVFRFQAIDIGEDENGYSAVFTVEADAFPVPGIYYGQAHVTKETGDVQVVKLVTDYTVCIDPTFDSLLGKNAGMVTLTDVRMFLMDTCVENNYLLGELEFKDEDIVYALRRAVGEFNETNVPLTNYTPHGFPFRSALVKGAAGYLLRSAAYRYERNTLGYRAGDVSVDDQNKAGAYSKLAGMLLEEWHAFCVRKKITMNAERAWGCASSPYAGI